MIEFAADYETMQELVDDGADDDDHDGAEGDDEDDEDDDDDDDEKNESYSAGPVRRRTREDVRHIVRKSNMPIKKEAEDQFPKS